MGGDWKTRLRRILYRDLVTGYTTPREGRVDPTQFPEEEFPVDCPKCGYSLRMLPDGNCPECGKPFERGRLLVIQYVEHWGDHQFHRTRTGRWAKRLMVCGTVLCVSWLLFGLGIGIWARRCVTPSNMASTLAWIQNWHVRLIIVISITLLSLIYLTGSALLIHWFWRHVRRRRRVLRALQAGDND